MRCSGKRVEGAVGVGGHRAEGDRGRTPCQRRDNRDRHDRNMMSTSSVGLTDEARGRLLQCCAKTIILGRLYGCRAR